MVRATNKNPMTFLDMLLEVEMILISIIAQVARVGSQILMRVHMALIGREEWESLITDITLIKLLGVLNVNTFDVFFPLVVGLKKLLTKRARQSGSLM